MTDSMVLSSVEDRVRDFMRSEDISPSLLYAVALLIKTKELSARILPSSHEAVENEA
jgi:hypothetical protein